MKIKPCTVLSLWGCRVLAVLVLAAGALLPSFLERYAISRPMAPGERILLLASFYLCLLPILTALSRLHRLLINIRSERVFVADNVRCIRTAGRCCLAVCLLCVPAAFRFPALCFVVLMMAFLSLVLGVLTAVMESAVAIREENDLTV